MNEGTACDTSIIVVTYNSRKYIDTNIGSLVTTLPNNCELIVVDNASLDGTADTISQSFPMVRVLRNKDNVGFARANNQAANLARGEYLVLINPDTAVDAGWLDPLLRPLKSPTIADGALVGLTTPKIVMMNNPSLINAAGNTVHISGITACRGYGAPSSAQAYDSDGIVPAISGACFAIRADVWRLLGGFDESFFMYLEDTDLSIRAQLAGYVCLYVAGSTVKHDYKNAFSPQKLFFLERNRLLMITKNFRVRTVLCLLPSMILVGAMSLGYAALRGMIAARSVLLAYADCASRIIANRGEPRSPAPLSDYKVLARMTTSLPLTQVTAPFLERAINLSLKPFFDALLSLARWLA